MTISVGKIWDVPVRLHFSWFIITGLIAWSLAAGYLPAEYPLLSSTLAWVLGGLTAIGFALSVLLHELGHVYVALRNQIKVRGVTLFIFGGLAELTREPASPGAEFRIAVAGPAVSLTLAAISGALWGLSLLLPESILQSLIAGPAEYLCRINLILGLFNLIPGFPLDGGRVLRAAAWRVTGDMLRATRFASITGQVVAFGFIAFGIYTFIRGNVFNGMWMGFIGWFLQNAAATAYAQARFQESLAGARVEDVMRWEIARVPSLLSLDELVNHRLLTQEQQIFLVGEYGSPEGILSIGDIIAIPKRKWPFLTTRQVMRPMNQISPFTPEMDLIEAIRLMEENRLMQAPVVAALVPVTGQPNLRPPEVIGTLSKEDVLRFLQERRVIR